MTDTSVIGIRHPLREKSAAGPWGKAGRARPGLGTGRGGDVTGPRSSFTFSARSR